MALRGRREQKNETEHDDKVVEINAEMQGSLSFKDPVNLKICGNFSGSLDVRGSLTIGGKSEVQANINGDNVIVSGKVTGDILATKMLVLMPTAVIRGNIKTPKLNIVEGAVFHGNCQMMDDFLNMAELSDYLEIDTSEIEELASSGKIPATKLGNDWKFQRTQIDEWATSGRVA